jgi:nitrogen fixation protein FixH
MTVQRRSGWWYPYIYVGIFLVVLAVNLIMAYSAVHTFSGVEENAYEKGLAYNQTLAKMQAEQDLGWTVRAAIRPHADASGDPRPADVVAELRDRDGRPLTGLGVTATLVRPTLIGLDSSVPLVEQGDGRYMAAVVLPKPGLWELRLTARKGDAVDETVQRVLIR